MTSNYIRFQDLSSRSITPECSISNEHFINRIDEKRVSDLACARILHVDECSMGCWQGQLVFVLPNGTCKIENEVSKPPLLTATGQLMWLSKQSTEVKVLHNGNAETVLRAPEITGIRCFPQGNALAVQARSNSYYPPVEPDSPIAIEEILFDGLRAIPHLDLEIQPSEFLETFIDLDEVGHKLAEYFKKERDASEGTCDIYFRDHESLTNPLSLGASTVLQVLKDRACVLYPYGIVTFGLKATDTGIEVSLLDIKHFVDMAKDFPVVDAIAHNIDKLSLKEHVPYAHACCSNAQFSVLEFWHSDQNRYYYLSFDHSSSQVTSIICLSRPKDVNWEHVVKICGDKMLHVWTEEKRVRIYNVRTGVLENEYDLKWLPWKIRGLSLSEDGIEVYGSYPGIMYRESDPSISHTNPKFFSLNVSKHQTSDLDVPEERVASYLRAFDRVNELLVSWPWITYQLTRSLVKGHLTDHAIRKYVCGSDALISSVWHPLLKDYLAQGGDLADLKQWGEKRLSSALARWSLPEYIKELECQASPKEAQVALLTKSLQA
ncbi:MAG: hypothetical protein KDK78_09565 [Chlamydiia bacterium]|nr:hypothetical protein [Chlamydiia bacterium]